MSPTNVNTRDAVGRKDRRIDIILPAETTADSNVSDTLLATVWASFEERGGVDATGRVAEAASVFVVWYRSGITPRHVVIDRVTGRRFQIESVADRTGMKIELELACTESQAGGDNA